MLNFKFNDLLTALRDDLANDTTLDQLAQEYYSKSVNLQIGYDDTKKPNENLLPMIYFFPIDILNGMNIDDYVFSLGARIVISNNALNDNDGIKEQEGIFQLCEFYSVFEKIMLTNQLTYNFYIDKFDPVFHVTGYGSLKICDIEIDIVVPNTLHSSINLKKG